MAVRTPGALRPAHPGRYVHALLRVANVTSIQAKRLDGARLGSDPVELGRYLRSQIDLLCQQLKAAQLETAAPESRSLAGALAAGHKPDPKVAPALRQLTAELASQPPAATPQQTQAKRAQLIAEFQKTVKEVSPLDVALAVFGAALDDTQPTPQRIQLLDELLRQHRGHPRWVETSVLRRLAALSERVPKDPWAGGSAHRLLEVVARAEQA